MLNQHSIATLQAAKQTHRHGWILPQYGSYCFAGIPSLVRACLDTCAESGLPADVLGGLPQHYDRVISILIDGFGWQAFKRRSAQAHPHSFLRRVLERGVASKLSSQFPSTTAAHMTTLHTGIPVGQSGVFEWYYYEPQLLRLFSPLIYKTVEGPELLPLDAGPESLFPRSSLYQQLAQVGVRSACFMRPHCIDSPFSRVVCRGAERLSYVGRDAGIAKLGTWLEASTEPSYAHLYFDELDSVGHHHGPGSRAYAQELAGLDAHLESMLHPILEHLPGRSLVLITADHGQLDVEPEQTIYLDRELPELASWLRRDGKNRPLRPGGSPRDMFLYIQPEHLARALEQLTTLLQGRALVLTRAAMLDAGLFGPNPSTRLHKRLGDIALLPHGNRMVWWRGEGEGEVHKRGHHGGLDPAEMEIPLLALAYVEGQPTTPRESPQ